MLIDLQYIALAMPISSLSLSLSLWAYFANGCHRISWQCYVY